MLIQSNVKKLIARLCNVTVVNIVLLIMLVNLSFISNEHTRKMVANGHQAVTQLELWPWLSTFEPEDGFMYTTHENITAICNKMESLPNAPGHSGFSFGFTMRHLQFMAKHGMKKYKDELLKV